MKWVALTFYMGRYSFQSVELKFMTKCLIIQMSGNDFTKKTYSYSGKSFLAKLPTPDFIYF